jgi:hypothetical protein
MTSCNSLVSLQTPWTCPSSWPCFFCHVGNKPKPAVVIRATNAYLRNLLSWPSVRLHLCLGARPAQQLISFERPLLRNEQPSGWTRQVYSYFEVDIPNLCSTMKQRKWPKTTHEASLEILGTPVLNQRIYVQMQLNDVLNETCGAPSVGCIMCCPCCPQSPLLTIKSRCCHVETSGPACPCRLTIGKSCTRTYRDRQQLKNVLPRRASPTYQRVDGSLGDHAC